MSGTMSKRQQARNEKVLHELAQALGNNVCADCSARNPSWASWSLGIFLCMRCATIHRKLGTHISKVKSLSMDSWSNEQVENMKKVGNIASNKSYNPDNKKPPIPGDADDVDPAMERFIRQKYMQRSLAGAKKHNTGSTSSDETPPPLPPKTGSRFGLRSASSIFPLGSKKKHDTGRSASPGPRSPASPRTNGGYGATVRFESNDADETEIKLQKLRDMGFRDEQRNAMVLKGVGGNLEKTIEALVRLGEGSEARTPLNLNKKQTPTASSQSLAPSTSSQDAARGRPISPASTNPFDMFDQAPLPPQPLSSQSTGTLQNRNPYNMTTTNPFGVPQQSAPQQQQPQQQQAMSAFDQAFQNLSLAPSQPLFPHHTGGMIAPQQQQNVPAGYQQPQMTGPAQQNYPSIALASSQAFPLTSQATGYNPFFNNQQQQQQQQQQPQTQFQPQQPMTINTTGYAGSYANNPFAKSPTRLQSPTLTQIPEQSQQNFYAGGQAQAPVAMPLGMQQTGNNPFFNQAMGGMPQQQQAPQQYGLAAQMTGQVPQYQTQGQAQGQMQMQNPQGSQMPQMQQGGYAPQQQYQPQQQQQQYQPQQQYQQQYQPQRPDKASILALYNYPQLAPQPPQAQQQNPAQAQGQQPPTQAGQANGAYGQQGQPQQQQQQQQQQMQQPQNQGAGSQMAGSKNPFMSAGGPAQGQQQNVAAPKPYNASRESVMALGMEWTNGRHSPDAFASLSARSGH
ncbi:Protein gts1 [Neurospora sp. IMI 360204]|nr:Protein gts1 [Neurospora sp. IMI 360204]